MVLGVVAGVVNVLVTTPLWVVNTRLKLQGAKFRNEDIVPTNYRGIIDAFHQIIRDEGVLALWNGTFPSLLLVFNPAIQFMFYEGFKRKLLKKQLQLTSLDAFVIGAIAKAVATTLTYPLQTVQSILRVSNNFRVTLPLTWSVSWKPCSHGLFLFVLMDPLFWEAFFPMQVTD